LEEELMIGKTLRLVGVGILLAFCQLLVFAQAGSIVGTVVDSNGSVVPNATVVVKGESGQDFTVTTNENGVYRVPGVAVGVYTVTVTGTGFKKSVVSNVKVDIGTPRTADVVLEAGNINEVVEVASGGEVLQTETATVGTNITGRQINETPISSRDALDLILRLPGVASVGAPRQSSINGLPKGAIQLTLDGVDVQDNVLRSSDGFFTFVRPRVDAIEEVTVSTASPGAEATGDGAVQVRFVTKRGTNEYRGTAYWQVRNTSLNAAYWYNNRDKPFGVNSDDQRDISKLNQPGFAIGGPIPFPRFGEGGPRMDSGKDKAFFFVNYEEFRLPGSQARTRTVLKPDVMNGTFKYITGGVTNTVNLFNIGALGGGPNTIDPTVQGVLNEIQTATAFGTRANIVNNSGVITDPNRDTFTFTSPGAAQRKFFVLRLDVNFTKKHSGEFIMNRQNFLPSIDFINGNDSPFPGGPSYGQGGVRKSWTWAVRSTFAQNVINEARYAVSGGRTDFAQGCCADDFASQNGRILGIGGALGITNLRAVSGTSGRTTPTYDWTDNLTWTTGNHIFTFGGQFKRVRSELISQGCCPSVGFGIDEVRDSTLYNSFNATTLPGADATQLAQARAFYAGLVGRITSYGDTAVLTADGTFVPGGENFVALQQKTYGLYAQDSWRINQSLNVTLGLRWQPRMSVTAESPTWTKLANPDMIYGTSGPDSLFRPGPPATNVLPQVVPYEVGEKLGPDDRQNWAPSFGAVYTPNFGDNGILRFVFGETGKSVFRAGWSRSFVREGLNVPLSVIGANPGGGAIDVSRTFNNGALTPMTNLRDPGNANLTPNQTQFTPNFPYILTDADAPGIYADDLQTGYVDSFNVGYQRELDKNTVVEVRYVGNRGRNLERQVLVNEFNILENGAFAEFQLAQKNLYANIAANRCQTGVTAANCQYNFAYFGPGTGTSPLPMTLAYFNALPATLTPGALGQSGTVTGAASLLTTNYGSANFRSTTFTQSLNQVNPNARTWASNIEGNSVRRANALAAGLPANFFYANHLQRGNTWKLDNLGNTWYDSGVIEVRRRLSQGLRVQASYVFSKAQTDMFAVSSILGSNVTAREFGNELSKTVQPFDLRHNFKLDATYDLPFGRGRMFFSNAGRLVDALIGGFTILPVISWQSGAPIQLGNVHLVGMTVKELQSEVKVRKNPTTVTWLPDDIIQNSIRAFNTSVTTASGYSASGTFNGTPTGRYIAPAGYGNCITETAGRCGFNNLVIYGPTFFKLDVGVNKRIPITERVHMELRANFLDALNHANFKLGGFGANTASQVPTSATFGQLSNTSAYRDNNTTNDPGGRVIDLQLRVTF
jgi:hypothetical protein